MCTQSLPAEQIYETRELNFAFVASQIYSGLAKHSTEMSDKNRTVKDEGNICQNFTRMEIGPSQVT